MAAESELIVSGFIREHKLDKMMSQIIPIEIPLIIAAFYPICIAFEGNAFNLSLEEKINITSWLQQQLLQDKEEKNIILSSQLLYDGRQHGFTPIAYNIKCDKESNKLTIVETEYNHIFGCFISVPTDSNQGGYISDKIKPLSCLNLLLVVD